MLVPVALGQCKWRTPWLPSGSPLPSTAQHCCLGTVLGFVHNSPALCGPWPPSTRRSHPASKPQPTMAPAHCPLCKALPCLFPCPFLYPCWCWCCWHGTPPSHLNEDNFRPHLPSPLCRGLQLLVLVLQASPLLCPVDDLPVAPSLSLALCPRRGLLVLVLPARP